MLGSLLFHPVRFFEVLPKIPDVRAPTLFLAFSSFLAAILWLIFEGLYPALIVLSAPLPLTFPLAGLYHLASAGGRYGYLVTWRILAYPFGFCTVLSAVPGLRWVAAVYAGVVLLGVGLATVRELGPVRAALASTTVTGLLFAGTYALLAGV